MSTGYDPIMTPSTANDSGAIRPMRDAVDSVRTNLVSIEGLVLELDEFIVGPRPIDAPYVELPAGGIKENVEECVERSVRIAQALERLKSYLV